MIRINLLPVGRRPIEEKVRREVSLFLLLLVCSALFIAYVHIGHTREIERISQEKKTTAKEIDRYRGRQKQLDKLKKQEDIWRQKLKIINNLRKNRDLPARLLNELATLIPSDKMWFREVSQKGNTLTIDGVARGNETIAQFMESLARSSYFDANGVVLKRSRQLVLEDSKLKSFSLSCKIAGPSPDKEETKKKGKQKKV
jgi:type IV pilus assembly protein PilN